MRASELRRFEASGRKLPFLPKGIWLLVSLFGFKGNLSLLDLLFVASSKGEFITIGHIVVFVPGGLDQMDGSPDRKSGGCKSPVTRAKLAI